MLSDPTIIATRRNPNRGAAQAFGSGLFRRLTWTLGLGLLAAACSSPDDESSPTVPDNAAAITDANNYTAVTVLTLPHLEAPPSGDVDVCWQELTSDIQCQAIPDPAAAIQQVMLLHFEGQTEEQISTLLAGSIIPASSFKKFHGISNLDGTRTCIKLSELGATGAAFSADVDFQPGPESKFVMVWYTGNLLGVGARSMAFVTPTVGSANTVISAPAACAAGQELLDFTPDLVTPATTKLPAVGPWVVDWSGLTRDGGGFVARHRLYDSALLAFYAGETAATLQTKVLDLENIATVIYDQPRDGMSNTLDMKTLVSRADGVTPFTGFTRAEEGVWMLALRCSTCQNPAPVLLTVVEPI